MRPLILILALLGGSTAAAPYVADLEPNEEYELQLARYKAYDHACELTGLCSPDIDVPEVELLHPFSAVRGLYKGGDTIYITARLRPGPDRMVTLIHESIHYLHMQNGLLPPMPIQLGPLAEDLCWSESEAFRLGDQWLASNGYEEMQRGPEWWKPYWHCRPFYDPEFDIWEWVKGAV